MGDKLVECVPNFSEGRDLRIIEEISNTIVASKGVSLLDVDSSEDFNRTVISFVGAPEDVLNAAIECTKKGVELIDMRKHSGEHARMGAVDVVPFIPIHNSTMEDCIDLAERFAKSVGDILKIPVYLYAEAAKKPNRVLLPTIRKGEYEGFETKIKQEEWVPDEGPQKFIPKSGAIASGARQVLIAYNINLNTDDKTLANKIAGIIRTSGILKKDEFGNKILDEGGVAQRIPGKFKSLQAAGWMYDKSTAQVSMNLLNYSETGMHTIMEAVKEEANKLGLDVIAGELVGLVPLKAMTDAGFYYNIDSKDDSIENIVNSAVIGLGLDALGKFNSKQRIIEWAAN